MSATDLAFQTPWPDDFRDRNQIDHSVKQTLLTRELGQLPELVFDQIELETLALL